jgi:endonuclease G
MQNKSLEYPLETYAVSIDNLEKVTGLNVFTNLSEKVEFVLIKEDWFDNLKLGDREPINFESLPKKCFYTVQATKKIGREVSVCGHVVPSRYSRKGHLWLNLDRQFPNQIFSIFVRKEDLVNFEYNLKKRYTNQSICVEGKIENFSDSPSITIKGQSQIALFKKII